MGLIPLSGPSSPELPQEGDQTASNVSDLLDRATYVEFPNIQQIGLDVDTYVDVNNALQAYIEGSKVLVTYYRLNAPMMDNRAHVADQVTDRHIGNTSVVRYFDFPIYMKDAVAFNWEALKAETSLSADGDLLPGIIPFVGDFFILPMGGGVFYKFAIKAVTPLAFFAKRVHRISFYFDQIANPDIMAAVNGTVTRTFYHVGEVTANGYGSFLEQDTFRQRQLLRQLRPILSKFYYAQFFNASMGTLLGPGDVYDPYVVKFCMDKIPYTEVSQRASQLYLEVNKSFPRTFWGRLLDSKNLNLKTLWQHYTTDVHRGMTNDVGFTTLINRKFHRVQPAPIEPPGPETEVFTGYVLGDAFYSDTPPTPGSFQELVHDAISLRYVKNIDALLDNFLNTYDMLTEEEQFFRIPVYLHLIDMAIQQIVTGR